MVFIQKTLSHGAVACGDMAVAEAAAHVIDKGGNAFDAAFTAILTSALVEPVFTSPGGGGLATLRHNDGSISTIDFFVDLPAVLNRDADIQEIHADFGTVQQAFHI
ncbi:MAG: gamma-glutamyltransferase, partial [Hyphomicrobiales bacterium]